MSKKREPGCLQITRWESPDDYLAMLEVCDNGTSIPDTMAAMLGIKRGHTAKFEKVSEKAVDE